MKIAVENIIFSYNYDKVGALAEVSFQVRQGEVLGIVGPNGSGKSTLLKCVNKLLKPQGGSVFLDDINLTLLNQKAIAGKIGVVSQNSMNYFPFSVFDFVLMGRFPHLNRFKKETAKDFNMVEKCLKLCGIEYLASCLISEISGGEHQKVIIARALAQEPKILLLDEPTLHLDISCQIELLELINTLAGKEKLIVIMVSHDLNLASRFTNRILILKNGRIYKQGLPGEVLTREVIRQVYGVETEIIKSPISNSVNIIPVSTVKK